MNNIGHHPLKNKGKAILGALLAIALMVVLTSSCSNLIMTNNSSIWTSFDDYQAAAIRSVRGQSDFQTANHELETFRNTPHEWDSMTPASKQQSGSSRDGVLLVHGLGDSPWSFHDLAERLSADGYIVRTILLPGHGTKPADMLDVTAEQWQTIVNDQADALARDIDGNLYLGGFSTGANLILNYAYQHPDVDGLLLFSPGFKSFSFGWLAPLLASIRPWLITPTEDKPQQNEVRYMNVPINGYAQDYRSSITAQKWLENAYKKPVFMVVSEHDSVLDTDYLLDTFNSRFTHPDSRLIWYGKLPDPGINSSRILVRSDFIPEERISQFSHMGILFSPDNPLYGRNGTLRICLNSTNSAQTAACEAATNSVWFSAWGYEEDNKVHARLTFNPYFSWQYGIMRSVLDL